MLLICDAIVPWAAPPPPSTHQLLHRLLLLPAFCSVSGLHFCCQPPPQYTGSLHPVTHTKHPVRKRGALENKSWEEEGVEGEEQGRGGEGGAFASWVGFQVEVFGPVPLAPPTGFLASPTLCGATSTQHSCLFCIFASWAELTLDRRRGIPIVTGAHGK